MKKAKVGKNKSAFDKLAKHTAHLMGKPLSFTVAAALILAWIVTGPLFDFSDTWQLVINTTTTIVTFLMVFVIQNTQNRDGQAIQLKLDELIRTHKGAHVILMDIEELSDDELEKVRAKYEKLAEQGRLNLRKGKPDTGMPAIKLSLNN